MVGVNGGVGTGDFTGRITIMGNRPGLANVLDNLKIYGSVSGGNFDLHGNVGTIEIAKPCVRNTTATGDRSPRGFFELTARF